MLHPADLLQGQRGIIAIRHQGKLYSFLHKPLQLQPGDWLLLQTGLLQEPTVNQSDNQSGENQAEET
ncbi:MAG: hypothetical protein HC825_08715 [Oscillatoriales cyanobacterium RM1_1_9]|nr:hypothetical protein [Oscillatoriales cyanobacterium RM1_1_9]